MSGFWKRAEAPAGTEYYCPPPRRKTIDCPLCRYGTVVVWKSKGKTLARCVDCRSEFPPVVIADRGWKAVEE